MLDEQEFAALRERMELEDAAREEMIKRSRDILKASKQAIYGLHRGDTEGATSLLNAAEKTARELLTDTRQDALSSALEEYVEARAFLVFLREGRLATLKELAIVEPEEYLLGLCDLTGELGRHAVHRATARDADAVRKVRDMLDAIHGQLLRFDFRNGELRRKYDGVKYALQKVEQLLCELALT